MTTAPCSDGLDQSHGDVLPVGGSAGCEHVAPGGAHHHFESDQAAAEGLKALPAVDPATVVLNAPAQIGVLFCVQASSGALDRLPAPLAGGGDQEREARRPAVGCLQHVDDEVDVLAQRVGVVRLRGLDGFGRACRDVAGAAPQRRPPITDRRIARIEEDERPIGRGRQTPQLALVGGVSLLVDEQYSRTVLEGARSEQTPGRGCLAGAGAAADKHVATVVER